MSLRRRPRSTSVALLLAATTLACSSTPGADRAGGHPQPPTSQATPSSPVLETTSTTTSLPPVPTEVAWPAPPGGSGGRGLVRTPAGFVLPVVGAAAGGSTSVATPCGATAVVRGTPIEGVHVVLDAGHGGNELGAQGPTGLLEKDVNWDVAQRVQARLEAAGATVVQARWGDQNTTIATRASVATAAGPLAFVSIHHNAEPDGPSTGPGTEAYYQVASADSKRLAGLIWHEVATALSAFEARWQADRDAGAKYRPGSRGGDYYGILRRAAGVPTVLSEAAFVTNPDEEALLRRPEVRQAEADAIARAIIAFVTTDDPGSGFVEPYPREEPAGAGGGPEGCVDPTL